MLRNFRGRSEAGARGEYPKLFRNYTDTADHPKIMVNENFQKDFCRHLIGWYHSAHRTLPWRETRNPYFIWVSEAMLQQTQVQTVIPYYGRFIETFPILIRLADADIQDVLKIWEGLGYYSRARHLYEAARIVCRTYGGTIPDTWASFRKLPGVGDYIAAAVLSFAFRQPHAVVDGNVKRVLARIFEIDEPVNQLSAKPVYQSVAKRLLSLHEPDMFNQAVMELGALICTPKNPGCENCPMSSLCRSFQNRSVSQYPKRVESRSVPTYAVSVGMVQNAQNRFLITRRAASGLLGGLWEFPGGKIQLNETPETACLREIREEVNLKVRIVENLGTIRHAYTHFRIIASVFLATADSSEVVLNGPVDYQWVSLDQISQYPLPKATHKMVALFLSKMPIPYVIRHENHMAVQKCRNGSGSRADTVHSGQFVSHQGGQGHQRR